MKKLIKWILIKLCLVLIVLPAVAQSSTFNSKNEDTRQKDRLYRIWVNTNYESEKKILGYFGAPYRAVKDGAVIGGIRYGEIVEVLSYQKGGYAKVKYNGQEIWVWADKLVKIKSPKAVCSAWAFKDMMQIKDSNIGIKEQWSNWDEDYTVKATRKDMAIDLVNIMKNIYGDWSVKFSLKTYREVHKDVNDFSAQRLCYWNVTPDNFFIGDNINKPVTFDDYTKYLLLLFQYDLERNGRKSITVNKTVVNNFIKQIGGNTSSSAYVTKEQSLILSHLALLWYQKEDLIVTEKIQKASVNKAKQYEGQNVVYTGIYTIQTYLGKKSGHPYLTINTEGNGELQSNKPQRFKVTYIGNRYSGYIEHIYTIQTMDSKYLAIKDMAVNGSRLIIQSTPYQWVITGGRGGHIRCSENTHQMLNASGWKTENGTHVITWFSLITIGTDTDNCKFFFEYAK